MSDQLPLPIELTREEELKKAREALLYAATIYEKLGVSFLAAMVETTEGTSIRIGTPVVHFGLTEMLRLEIQHDMLNIQTATRKAAAAKKREF